MSQTYAAYDYETQQWLSGERARVELVRQLQEERAIIDGPGGAKYLRSIGVKLAITDALASIDGRLAALAPTAAGDSCEHCPAAGGGCVVCN